MVTLHPDLAEVTALVERMEGEVAEFVAGLDATADMAVEDVREQSAYVAALRVAIAGLGADGEWSAYTGDIPYVQTFMIGAVDSARDAENWAAVSCYADFLRRLTEAS